MTSDAHHFVVPHMATIRQCICDALADAGLSAGDIAAVNAHATSTRIGDKVEFDALRAIFPDALPPVSANKSQIGHAMGASSAIETIFALRGMEEDVILPTINYQADPDMDIDCVAEGKRTLRQEHLLKNAFGFGGCNACAIFRRVG
jgi:3-oxoacyl-[acyl-carrier-protein] synthase II